MSCSPTDIGCWLDWLSEEIKAILINIFDAILQGLATIFALIPAPAWSQNIGTLTGLVPPEFWWMAEFFQISLGAQIMAAAMLIRFTIRRIPGIG